VTTTAWLLLLQALGRAWASCAGAAAGQGASGAEQVAGLAASRWVPLPRDAEHDKEQHPCWVALRITMP
jgi:hypothetical protein